MTSGRPIESASEGIRTILNPLSFRTVAARAEVRCAVMILRLSFPSLRQHGSPPLAALGRPDISRIIERWDRLRAGRQYHPRLLRRGVDVDVWRQAIRFV